MITGIEIENPYRYRSYFVGSCANFDVQNFAYNVPEEEVQDNNLITKIEERITAPNESIFAIFYEKGNSIAILSNTAGLIVHYDTEK